MPFSTISSISMNHRTLKNIISFGVYVSIIRYTILMLLCSTQKTSNWVPNVALNYLFTKEYTIRHLTRDSVCCRIIKYGNHILQLFFFLVYKFILWDLASINFSFFRKLERICFFFFWIKNYIFFFKTRIKAECAAEAMSAFKI